MADFNNDRKLDLAVSGPDEGVILIYLGDGKGGFIFLQPNWRIFGTARASTSADFNGDGNQDFGIVTMSQITCHIFLGDGTGKFNTGAEFSVNHDAGTWRLAT